jgi:hypothetical protein
LSAEADPYQVIEAPKEITVSLYTKAESMIRKKPYYLEFVPDTGTGIKQTNKQKTFFLIL